MDKKKKQTIVLLIYFLSPIVASIIYYITSSNVEELSLLNRVGSTLGILAFIWMCFNILLVCKFKIIEENFSLDGVMKFHTRMSAVAIALASVHYPISFEAVCALKLFTQGRTLSEVVYSGGVAWLIFIILMTIALIFMKNGAEDSFFMMIRNSFFKINIRYNVNKVLHNLTLVAAGMALFHALSSTTSKSSLLMRLVYFFFALITFIGWGYHKIIRRFRPDSDPYMYRKASWDVDTTEIIPKKDKKWALSSIENTPSLYPCLQCGSCTVTCPVSEITEGDFNPRLIIKLLLDGAREKILNEKQPNVWACTHCHSCDEICPQGVHLSNSFNFVRNISAEQKEAPEGFLNEAKNVYLCGEAIPRQDEILKRREILNLPARVKIDMQEIHNIMDMTGFHSLVETHSTEAEN